MGLKMWQLKSPVRAPEDKGTRRISWNAHVVVNVCHVYEKAGNCLQNAFLAASLRAHAHTAEETIPAKVKSSLTHDTYVNSKYHLSIFTESLGSAPFAPTKCHLNAPKWKGEL